MNVPPNRDPNHGTSTTSTGTAAGTGTATTTTTTTTAVTQDPTLFVGGTSGRIVVERNEHHGRGGEDVGGFSAAEKLHASAEQQQYHHQHHQQQQHLLLHPYDVGQLPGEGGPGGGRGGGGYMGASSKATLPKHAPAKAAAAAKKRKSFKKPEGKPKRPLSAYNLFFHQERKRLLGDDADEFVVTDQNKRRHRKTHGKIGFAEMAKLVSTRWNNLSPEEKKPFEEQAWKEKEKYKVALAEWKDSQEYQDFQATKAEEMRQQAPRHQHQHQHENQAKESAFGDASVTDEAAAAAAAGADGTDHLHDQDLAQLHEQQQQQQQKLQAAERYAQAVGEEHMLGGGGAHDLAVMPPHGRGRFFSPYMGQFAASGGGGGAAHFGRASAMGGSFAGGGGGMGMDPGRMFRSTGGVEATRAALTRTYGRMSQDPAMMMQQQPPQQPQQPMAQSGGGASGNPDEQLRRIEESYLRNLAEVSQLREQLRVQAMVGDAPIPPLGRGTLESVPYPTTMFTRGGGGGGGGGSHHHHGQQAELFGGMRGDPRSQFLRHSMGPSAAADVGGEMGGGGDAMGDYVIYERMRAMPSQRAQFLGMMDGGSAAAGAAVNEYNVANNPNDMDGRMPAGMEGMEHVNEARALRNMRGDGNVDGRRGGQLDGYSAMEAEARRVAVERALDVERTAHARSGGRNRRDPPR